MGIQQAMLGGSGIVNPLAGGTAIPVGAIPGGSVSVKSDGTIGVSNGADEDLQNWYLPTTTAVGANYYVKFTLTGTTYDNTASDWTQLDTARSARGIGSLLVQIAVDSGGVSIVTSGTYTLSA